jgi:uncharacterized protein YneF (UPF0154 family)
VNIELIIGMVISLIAGLFTGFRIGWLTLAKKIERLEIL